VVAAHLAAAGDEQGAAPYRLVAARTAMADAAWHEAVGQLRQARQVAGTPSVELLLGLGEALGGCGDSAGARDAFLQAAELARAVRDPEAFARAVLGYGAGLAGFEVSLFDTHQQRLLEEALERLPPGDSSLRSWLLGRLSVALSFTADNERRRKMAGAAVAMARRVSDDAALARALASWCDAVAGPEDSERRLTAANEMERAARAAGDTVHALLARRFRVVALLELGDVTAARREADAFAKEARRLRHPSVSWYVPLFRGVFALIAGRPEETITAAAEVLAEGRRTGSINAIALGMTQQLGCLLLQERYDEIAAMMSDEVLPAPEYEPTPSLRPTVALVNVITGRRDVAEAELDRAVLERFEGLPRHDSEWVGSLCCYVRVASSLGHFEAASLLHDLLAPYRHRFVVDGIGAGFWGSVSLWAGEAAEAAGRYAEARDLFEQSLIEHRRIAAPMLVAMSAAALERLETSARPPTTSAEGLDDSVDAIAVFRREGDGWRIRYAGRSATVRDSKGARDLAVLLARPCQEVHVLELATDRDPGTNRAWIGDVFLESNLGPVLDRRAAAEYRRRLAELEQTLEEAESDADLDRATRLRLEREAITLELSAAFGLGGRARRPPDSAERARKAVSGRIRDAIARIAAVHPELGRHLAASVHTGRCCSYDPERSVRWQI
jgi:tetratricopeptide (TPR) repeat protein